jgi:hypothetical protein
MNPGLPTQLRATVDNARAALKGRALPTSAHLRG